MPVTLSDNLQNNPRASGHHLKPYPSHNGGPISLTQTEAHIDTTYPFSNED